MTDLLLLSWLRANLQLTEVQQIIEEGSIYEPFPEDARRAAFASRVAHGYHAGDWGLGIEEDDAERLVYVCRAFSENPSRRQRAQLIYASSVGIESTSRKEYLMYDRIYSFLDTMITSVVGTEDEYLSCCACLFLHSISQRNELMKSLACLAGSNIAIVEGTRLIRGLNRTEVLLNAAHHDYIVDRWLKATMAPNRGD